jgi:DNA-binding CsgD family transcriptional regulator
LKCRECGIYSASVLETRSMHQGTVLRRARGCVCGAKYNTYEIDDGIWNTVRKWAVGNRVAVIKQRQKLKQRDAEIVARLKAGGLGKEVAAVYGLSEATVSYLRKRAGMPTARKARKATPWSGL